jgi:hypothetical protein
MGLGALGVVLGPSNDVPLSPQHRQRRAHFVSRVGGEAPLAREQRIDPFELGIDGPQQRRQFGRRVVAGQRLEVGGFALLQVGRDALDRGQGATHGPRQNHQQERQHQQPGNDLGQREVVDQLVPLVRLLARCHQPFAAGRAQVIHAPQLAVELLRDEAGDIGAARQFTALAVGKEESSLPVPDRNREVAQVGLAAGARVRGRQLRLRVRRVLGENHLNLSRQPDQLGVEELVDVVLRAVHGNRHRHQPDQRRRYQQVQHQAPLQAHGAGSPGPSA